MTNYIKATNLNHGDEVYYQSGEHLKDGTMIPYTVFNSENTLTTAKGEDGELVTLSTDRLYVKKVKETLITIGHMPRTYPEFIRVACAKTFDEYEALFNEMLEVYKYSE